MSPSKDVPSFGPRGEGWVALQVVVLAGVVLAVLFGPRWAPPRALAVLGAFVGAIGVTLTMSALLSLQQAGALTAFPRPLEGEREPLTEGPYALAPLVVLAVTFRLKSELEERWLLERYPRYAAYRERVRHRLVPYVW